MGSGLILLVIVGAWLAVLVPMALRSHDSTTSLSSVDRFSDAMRVLSRRQVPTAERRAFVVPGRPAAPSRSAAPSRPDARPSAPVSLAVRRRRALLALLAVAGTALLGSLLVGPLLYVHLALDLLVVAFVVHCRRQAMLRAARLAARHRREARAGRTAPARRTAAVHAPALAHVAGIPARMPARPAPLTAALPAPAARHDEPVTAALPTSVAGSYGSAWSPVPVPIPTYVTKPAAPARQPRVLDLTRPGEWTAALEGDAGLGIFDDADQSAAELDEILDRSQHRRAVND